MYQKNLQPTFVCVFYTILFEFYPKEFLILYLCFYFFFALSFFLTTVVVLCFELYFLYNYHSFQSVVRESSFSLSNNLRNIHKNLMVDFIFSLITSANKY